MISNIIIPVQGMIDTAIAGRTGEDVSIAALAVGTTIFNFIYWNCAFLRMGASGITAQAYGAGNFRECAHMLIRALWLALVIALLLVIFRKPAGNIALCIMQGSDAVRQLAGEYFFVRVWAVPASVSLFAIQGWFTGMQDARTPMFIAILSVTMNAVFSLLFVFRFEMGIAGIAWGTVAAQYTGLTAASVLWLVKYRGFIRYFDIRESLRLEPVVRFLHVHKDIFLRTACIVAVYTFFIAASARFGDTVLTTNALLMQLFTLFSYMSDGFAYAGEALSGRFVGERNPGMLKRYIRHLTGWSQAIAVLYVIIYLAAWQEILTLFSPSEEVLRTAGRYIIWIIAVPLAGSIPFMIDGIMIGATKTKLLRNTVFISTVSFFAVFYALSPALNNTALWIAFLVFLFSRGLLLYFCSGRLSAQRLCDGYIR
jgi:MATE family multidrug resistance protein